MRSAREGPDPSISRLKQGRLVAAGRGVGSARPRRCFNVLGLRPARGFTLLEMIAAMTILLLLSTLALPVARVQVQRTREVELRRDLRDLREALDRYKDYSDRGMIPAKADTYNYPPDLQTLVDGVVLRGTAKGKLKFLRRIPIDPMTGKADWGLRSMQDDPDSTSWGGENVFDVYCPSTATALDGTKYSDW